MRQARAGLCDVVDVEEHGTGDVAAIVIFPRRRGNSRQFEGRVDDPNMRVAKIRGEPLGADERFGMGVGQWLLPFQSKASMMRRFCLPLFSILVTATGPISLVLRICVPPQGCRSIPEISIRRICPIPLGGFTDIVRTSSGWAASSASVIHRGPTGRASAISSLRRPASISLLRLDPGTSKSRRPLPSET